MATQKKNEGIVTAICRQATIPKGATVIRLPGTGNARPSAIAPPFIKPVLNWSTPPAVVQQLLPADEAVVICTNDPLHAAIFTDKNPTATPLVQQWSFSGSPDNGTIALGPGMKSTMEDDLFCSIPAGATKAWHGPRLYALLWKGRYYMWCDAANAANAANLIRVLLGIIAMAAGDSLTATFYRLNEGDEITVQSTALAGPLAAGSTAFTCVIPTADWYRVDLQRTDAAGATASLQFSVQNEAISEILVHLALPDLSERMLNLVQSIRVLGASQHGINLVSDQNATGSWVGDQPEGSILYTSFIRGASGTNGFQKLSSSRGNELMELKKYNPYAWVAPESEKSWSYRQPFTFNATGGVTNTLNDEASTFDYTIVYYKAGGTAIAADPARNVQLEFYYTVEYLSEGIWMMPGVSPATNDDEDAARKVLCSMENIGHNPAFGEIMKTIGKYVRLSAPVLALLGPYGKAASVAATGIGEGIGMAFGYRTKKTARPPPDEAGNPGGAQGPPKAPRLAPVDARPEDPMAA